MKWADVGKTAARFAPALGAALGPGGVAVGSIIAAVYGVDNTPDAVSAAITSDPHAAVKLRQIELEHSATIAAVLAADVQHAREIHTGSRMPAILALIMTAIVVGMVAALVFVQIPTTNSDALYLIIGQVMLAWGATVTYWVGSSRGSLTKQSTIERVRHE